MYFSILIYYVVVALSAFNGLLLSNTCSSTHCHVGSGFLCSNTFSSTHIHVENGPQQRLLNLVV